MASTWGDAWSISWSFSWDIAGPEPEVVLGGKQLKGELFKPKRAETYPKRYPAPHPESLRKSAEILARSGGYARAESLTSKQRSSIATKAALARWK